jgi:hypothetical protein
MKRWPPIEVDLVVTEEKDLEQESAEPERKPTPGEAAEHAIGAFAKFGRAVDRMRRERDE